MKLLTNRKIAILITVILSVAATIFGLGRSLNRLARDVEVMFFDGVCLEDEGYTQPGIEAHLNSRLSSALALAVIMEDYPEAARETNELFSARNALKSAKSIGDKYTANEALQQAYLALQAKAESLELSLRDTDDIMRFSSDFSSAQTAIQDNRYNQKAESFMDDASFFARLLKPFAFVTPPQVFAH